MIERRDAGEAVAMPTGLGRRSSSAMSRPHILDSPWMGGGPGPAMLASKAKPKGGPPAQGGLKMEATSSVFVTQTTL